MASHHCMGARLAERRSVLSADQKLALERVVEHIGQPGKGISACDESGRTINPRFKNVGVEPTEEHRRAYRQCLFEAEGAADYSTDNATKNLMERLSFSNDVGSKYASMLSFPATAQQFSSGHLDTVMSVTTR